jgi:hypothetical protein
MKASAYLQLDTALTSFLRVLGEVHFHVGIKAKVSAVIRHLQFSQQEKKSLVAPLCVALRGKLKFSTEVFAYHAPRPDESRLLLSRI